MSASVQAGEPPANRGRDHVPATDHATRYQSRLTDPSSGVLTQDDLKLLSHVNCTYLSSGGHPPTLLALKRHAQSLAVLISKLSTARNFVFVSKRDGDTADEIPDVNNVRYTTMPYDAFDWLHDLSKPYDTKDELHHVPLWALSNSVREESEEHGVSYHCPLHDVQMKKSVLDEPASKPTHRFLWQTHSTLLQHANECLEILDSEYSDTGGILSILPVMNNAQSATDGEFAQEIQAARNTMIGQWIIHHQHLVARIHELEINYANALDLVEMDAIVPMELLSSAGTYIRANGQTAAYPQDRFILAGVNAEMQNMIHGILDEEESHDTSADAERREKGVVGDRVWRGENEDGYERGLVSVDLLSRFYRIKGARRSPIIIMPISEMHPSREGARNAESKPTVVALGQRDFTSWPDQELVDEAMGKQGGEPIERSEIEKLEKDRKELIQRNKELETVVDVLKRDLKIQRKKLEDEQQQQAVLDHTQARRQQQARGRRG